MTFTISRTPILYDRHTSGTMILRVIDDVVDLVFRLTSNFNPSPHIAIISNSAFKVLGCLMRLSNVFKLMKLLKYLYYVLVCSILEYGSILWYPCTVFDSN